MLLKDLFRERDEVITCQIGNTLAQVAGQMHENGVGAVVVVDAEDLVMGIITDRDIALGLALGAATPDSYVEEVMSRDVKTIWDDQGVFNATQYLQGHKIRRLPVVDRNNRLVGLITFDDVIALLTRELYNTAQCLESTLGHRV